MAASPDAIVCCDCCGEGCVEIKCVCRLNDPGVNFEEWIISDEFCLKKDKNNMYYMNPSHPYYYQVQLQMFCAENDYCDFFVWSTKNAFRTRVLIDDKFLKENIPRAQLFYQNVIIPKLLSKYYTSTKERVLLMVEGEFDYNTEETMDVMN